MVECFDVSLSSSLIRKKRKDSLFFLMKLELSETSKHSTIPVLYQSYNVHVYSQQQMNTSTSTHVQFFAIDGDKPQLLLITDIF